MHSKFFIKIICALAVELCFVSQIMASAPSLKHKSSSNLDGRSSSSLSLRLNRSSSSLGSQYSQSSVRSRRKSKSGYYIYRPEVKKKEYLSSFVDIMVPLRFDQHRVIAYAPRSHPDRVKKRSKEVILGRMFKADRKRDTTSPEVIQSRDHADFNEKWNRRITLKREKSIREDEIGDAEILLVHGSNRGYHLEHISWPK